MNLGNVYFIGLYFIILLQFTVQKKKKGKIRIYMGGKH